MSAPAFTAPLTALPLRAPSSRRATTPRCAATDSVAPAITLINTGSEQTSKVKIEWQPIPPNTSEAISVAANVALNISLRSASNSSSTSAPVEPCPPSIAPKDFYFSANERNLAPVISLDYNKSISVSFDKINPSVAGVEADAPDSIAFWKAPTYKYSAPDAPETPTPEILSTALYEAYFPSNIRNLAPMINIKKPAGEWDTSAYIEVGSEFVQLNTSLAQKIGNASSDEDTPSADAAATVAKYFGGEFSNMAPDILISESSSRVEFCLAEVQSPVEEATAILSEMAAQD